MIEDAFEEQAEIKRAYEDYKETVAWASNIELRMLLRHAALELSDRNGARYVKHYRYFCCCEIEARQRYGPATA